jgi:hypothetical protein
MISGMAKGGPIRAHGSDTTTGRWSGPQAEKKLGEASAKSMRKAYAWADPDGDPDNKGSYKFIHHEVKRGGEVGAANVKACRSGIGILNGGRGGANIPDSDRKGVWNHLARHLQDAGEEPPSLK